VAVCSRTLADSVDTECAEPRLAGRETKFGRNPLQRAEKTENLTQRPSGDPLGWLGCAGTSPGIFLDYSNT